MDDDDDVVLIESNDEENSSLSDLQKNETRPLMLLFDRLIMNDTKTNTVLTNLQIISILQKEYDIDVSALHPLEVNIYLNVVKKFLKDWPQWEEFDSLVNRLKKINATSSIKKILEHKYKHLKEFLRMMIEVTKPLAQKAVQNIPKTQDSKDIDTSDIILEIYCSRRQLNSLIYNVPHPEFSGTIFNLQGHEQKISLKEIPIESILNWFDISLTIDLKFFTYYRNTKHELSYSLVNEKLLVSQKPEKLNTNVQIYKSTCATQPLNKDVIKTLILGQIFQQFTPAEQKEIYCIFNVIKKDFEVMDNATLNIPGLYRQHPNEYTYYRKLFKPVPTEANKNETLTNIEFDLYIKEIISPMISYNIAKVSNVDARLIPPNFKWLKIKCNQCKFSLTGLKKAELVEHFKQYHTDEPDCICSNCGKTFGLIELTYRKWIHDCKK